MDEFEKRESELIERMILNARLSVIQAMLRELIADNFNIKTDTIDTWMTATFQNAAQDWLRDPVESTHLKESVLQSLRRSSELHEILSAPRAVADPLETIELRERELD